MGLGAHVGSTESLAELPVGDGGAVAVCHTARSWLGWPAETGTVLAATASPLQLIEPLNVEERPDLHPGDDGSAGLGFLNVPGLVSHRHRHSLNLRPRYAKSEAQCLGKCLM